MFKKQSSLIATAIIMLASLCCTKSSSGAPFFEDSFETGNFTKTSNGAGWLTGANTVVTTGRAHTGSYALRYYYPASSSSDAFAERRFTLGSAKTDVYIRFYVYFPSNYVHRSLGAANNKVIRIWGEEANYSANIKMGASFWPGNISTLAPDSYWENVGGERLTCSGGGMGPTSTANPGNWTLTPDMLNRWLCFEFHFKPDSGAGDGVFEFWVDGVRRISNLNLRYYAAPCTPGYFRTGYLLGHSNSGFTADTYIYIDDVAFSNTYIGPLQSGSPQPTTILDRTYTNP